MGGIGGHVPVLDFFDLALFVLCQVTWWQFANLAKCGMWIGDIAEVEELQNPLRVDFRKFGRRCQYRLDLRPKIESPSMLRIVEWFLAHTIPREQQRFAFLVIEGDREHASQLGDAIRPHLLVKVNNDFGIAEGIERMTSVFQFLA